MKLHGQAWKKLASVSTVGSTRDDASISLARRITVAIAAGDRDEAIRLTRDLERALANTPAPNAHAAPSLTAQPAVAPMTSTPTTSRSAQRLVADALAEIGVACRAKVATDYTVARFGQGRERLGPDASDGQIADAAESAKRPTTRDCPPLA